MLLFLLWTCGSSSSSEGSAPAATSGANQLLEALEDEPVSRERSAPARELPEGNVPTPEVEIAERTPACEAAERRYDEAAAEVARYRERVLLPAEDLMLSTGARLNECLMSPECQAQKESFGAISRRHDDAEKAYERAGERVPEMEAALFPLREAMLEACGGTRR